MILMMKRIALVQLLTSAVITASYAFRNNNHVHVRITQESRRSSDQSLASTTNAFISGTASGNSTSTKHSLHLVSLPPKDDSFSLPAESLIRDCWKWKDSVLGDGRDYFVPRPKTLKAFHSLFVGMEISVDVDFHLDQGGHQSNEEVEFSLNTVVLKLPASDGKQSPRTEVKLKSEQLSKSNQSKSISYVVEECVALSNCARFEIILVLKETDQQQTNHEVMAKNIRSMVTESAARLSVSYHLWKQTQNYKSKSDSLLQRSGLASWMDLPDAINTEKNIANNGISIEQTMQVMQLGKRLASTEGPLSISTHLSLIASGLAPRTNRPDRDVIFRPYSSRDAHILLQLKRTADVISILGTNNTKRAGCRLKVLLDSALSAGKAARNEKIVPDIQQLKEFGSDGTPPIGMANAVAEVRS